MGFCGVGRASTWFSAVCVAAGVVAVLCGLLLAYSDASAQTPTPEGTLIIGQVLTGGQNVGIFASTSFVGVTSTTDANVFNMTFPTGAGLLLALVAGLSIIVVVRYIWGFVVG